jgi:hypothetical protein
MVVGVNALYSNVAVWSLGWRCEAGNMIHSDIVQPSKGGADFGPKVCELAHGIKEAVMLGEEDVRFISSHKDQ